jgi:uncharacterized protein
MKAAPPAVRRKKALLREILRRHGSILVAFSGGKDSFFLLNEAVAALGRENVAPFFVATPFNHESARARVDYFRDRVPVEVRELRLDLLAGPRLRRNPRQRCFVCKQRMFLALKKEAARLGIVVVADGSTASDQSGYRPGRLALKKLGITSPLLEAGFTAAEIAADLARAGIGKFFLSPSTCLATRFPYGHRLDADEMLRIGQVEQFLAARGIYPLRVRYIPDGVRLETGPALFRKVLALKDDLLDFCRARGFMFVTLDLGGIKSGPWDEAHSAPKAKVEKNHPDRFTVNGGR